MLVRGADLGETHDQGSAGHGHRAALGEHASSEPPDGHRDRELGRLRVGGAAVRATTLGTGGVARVDGGVPPGRPAVGGASAAVEEQRRRQ